MDNDESFAEMSFETEQQDKTTVGKVEQALSNQTEADTSSNGTEALTNQLIQSTMKVYSMLPMYHQNYQQTKKCIDRILGPLKEHCGKAFENMIHVYTKKHNC